MTLRGSLPPGDPGAVRAAGLGAPPPVPSGSRRRSERKPHPVPWDDCLLAAPLGLTCPLSGPLLAESRRSRVAGTGIGRPVSRAGRAGPGHVAIGLLLPLGCTDLRVVVLRHSFLRETLEKSCAS